MAQMDRHGAAEQGLVNIPASRSWIRGIRQVSARYPPGIRSQRAHESKRHPATNVRSRMDRATSISPDVERSEQCVYRFDAVASPIRNKYDCAVRVVL